MVAEFLAALKAIPALVDGLREISKAITFYHESIMRKEFEEKLSQLNTYARQLENAKSKDEIASIIRNLNSIKL